MNRFVTMVGLLVLAAVLLGSAGVSADDIIGDVVGDDAEGWVDWAIDSAYEIVSTVGEWFWDFYDSWI